MFRLAGILLASIFIINIGNGQTIYCSEESCFIEEVEAKPRNTDLSIQLLETFSLVENYEEDEPILFKFKIESLKEIKSFTARYTLDRCENGSVELTFTDDGVFPDEVADDGVYTANESSCVYFRGFLNSNVFFTHYIYLVGKIIYDDDSEDVALFQTQTHTILDQDRFNKLEVELTEYNDSISYTPNLIILKRDKQFSQYEIDYPYEQLKTTLERYWDFENSRFSFITFNSVSSRYSEGYFNGQDFFTLGFFRTGLLRHEILHIWTPAMKDMELTNSFNHWDYLVEENSGFGKGCSNGLFNSFEERNDTIFWEYDRYSGSKYNNVEMNLMGLLPLDSISFPIQHFEGDNLECVANFGNDFGTGYILNAELNSINRDDYLGKLDQVQNALDISNGLDMKIVVVTSHDFNEDEIKLLDSLGRSLKQEFDDEYTSGNGVLNSLIPHIDLDNDNSPFFEDCNDNNSDISPLTNEIVYNGLDDDCNETTLDDDLDQDGFNLTDDCNDEDASINPDAEEIPNNGIDENCDGEDVLSSTAINIKDIISIYPNPVKEIINIKTKSINQYEYSIIDIHGIKIINTTNKNINLSQYPVGLYFLEVIDLNSEQSTRFKILRID